jgi:hypothetical protein
LLPQDLPQELPRIGFLDAGDLFGRARPPRARPARRPPNAALATEALRATGIPLRPWRDALAALLAKGPPGPPCR